VTCGGPLCWAGVEECGGTGPPGLGPGLSGLDRMGLESFDPGGGGPPPLPSTLLPPDIPEDDRTKLFMSTSAGARLPGSCATNALTAG